MQSHSLKVAFLIDRSSQSKESGQVWQFLAGGDGRWGPWYLFRRIVRFHHLARTDGHPVAQVRSSQRNAWYRSILIILFVFESNETERAGWRTLTRRRADGVGDLFRSRQRPWTPAGSYSLLSLVKPVPFRRWPWPPTTSDSVVT